MQDLINDSFVEEVCILFSPGLVNHQKSITLILLKIALNLFFCCPDRTMGS